ncbi:single-stranded DNA-binding protein [bacterium]|nr:single-stranded DNA-binding protein [bacterium]
MLNVAAMEIRLGHDPELRYTKSGTAVTNFSGANNRRYNGNEYTNWPRFVCWGKLAEIVVQYLKKGSHANLCGELRTRTWEDKDGKTQYATEIFANDVSFLDKKGDRVEAKTDEAPPVEEDRDIPF